MKAAQTKLKNCWILEPNVFEDERGYFYEVFNMKKFKETTGTTFEVKQINQSRSHREVLRGLHFQKNPKAQAKLVSCIEGEVLDVAVDLRRQSSTFGQWTMARLSDQNKRLLFIPKGMAHGFLVLSNNAKLMYQVDELYSPAHNAGIRYDDPELNINWGIAEERIILSKKDQLLPMLKEVKTNF